MQMEPWRKRGYVPDSDEDDGFDSLDTSKSPIDDGNDEVNLDYITLPAATSSAQQPPTDRRDTESRDGIAPSGGQIDEHAAEGSQELMDWTSSPRSNHEKATKQNLVLTGGSKENPTQGVPSKEELTTQRGVPMTYGRRRLTTKTPTGNAHKLSELPPDLVDDIWDIPSSPVTQSRSGRKTTSQDTTTKASISVQRLHLKSASDFNDSGDRAPNETGRSRSSSPDELAFILPPPSKAITATNNSTNAQPEDIRPPAISDDDSPLSSPPSSLQSPPPYANEIEMAVAPTALPPEETNPNVPNPDQSGENPAEMQQPVRRSFRERNAIQLHPYALEMAKYQRLMQERGIRPVRMAMPPEKHQRKNETTDESQEQDDFDPTTLGSSPPPEEFLPPPRSAQRDESDSTGQKPQQRDHQNSPIRRTHSQKRRKRSYSGNWSEARRSHQGHKPQVVINVDTTPNDRQGLSVFDITSSPPHSRSVSSASKTPRASKSFQLPLELTPPQTTITGRVPDLGLTERVESNGIDPGKLVSIVEIDDDSESHESQQSSIEAEEDAEDRRIRELQRKTRGVLPASWVRLNAEQVEKQKSGQSNRNGSANARVDGKGIAKKITRKPGKSERATSGLSRALFEFADFDESEEDDHSTTSSIPARIGAGGDLDTEHIFNRHGDAMEDNRIDYMLAPVSRKSSGPHEKHKGLKRVKSKESSGQTERRLKKARLQRQTRLTDSSYGGKRTKQISSRSSPRLGILDAPDVATRPRKEQPLFLRIAARGARSRQDQGRQSPTRKFVQLSSRQDTADANKSLHDWKRGSIPRAKTIRAPSKPRKRQGLTRLASGSRHAGPVVRNSRITNHFPLAEIESISDVDHQPVPATLPSGEPSIPVALAPSHASGDVEPPAKSKRQGRQWVVQRHMPITSLRRNDPRPAPTSLAAPQANPSASKDMFSRSLTLLNRRFRHENSSRAFKSSLTLDRFIADKGSAPQSLSEPHPVPTLSTEIRTSDLRPQPTRRRLKKKKPTRIDLESDEFVQDQTLITTISDDSDSAIITDSAPIKTSTFSVGGMFNWQRSYPIDFETAPLRAGTFFHESTFIGSGEFARSLQIAKRDLDQEAGFASIAVKDRISRWGAWNECVSLEMGDLFQMIQEDVEKSVSTLSADDAAPGLMAASRAYRSLINYVTDHLSFFDPVDRTSFTIRGSALASSLRDSMAAFIAGKDDRKSDLVRIAYYNMLFANQLLQISSHALVCDNVAEASLKIIQDCASDTIALIMSESGVSELRRFFEDNKTLAQREAGIREQYPTVEACLVSETLLRRSEKLNRVFNDLQADACKRNLARNNRDVASMELEWRRLFSLLPINDIDDHGIARRKNRFRAVHDNWTLVKKLLSPALDNYSANSATQPISYNKYCRTLFQRCHRLINTWGWRECRPILETLYDFFAQNTLYNLKLEESRGSPSFLDQLDQNPSLDVQPGEPCFHTLLKIIASGLRFLSERYSAKQVRNFAWRLLPNHGRMYPKENDLRCEDLDALRNHHDLLCTLYWVIPPGLRFRVEIIRDLVHPTRSHNETCSINLRAWTRLVRFKLSTNEDISELESFANWHRFFVTELRQQHAHVRKEIEAQKKDGEQFSQHHIENVIASNQRSTENLLSMALNSMQTAIERAPSIEHALCLISKTPFESLLGLFNPKLARVNVVVSHALQVIVTFVQKDSAVAFGAATQKAIPAAAVSTEDDSQEFDDVDWDESLDHAMVQPEPPSEGVQHVEKVLHPIVSRLLSNCFGEDYCPEDAILTSVVDCWTSIAQMMVFHKLRQWDNYLDPVSIESWASLRGTVQTRKFTPRFLAGCIEKDSRILAESRVLVISMWISCLVERPSLLKFQHRLTEALLNGSPQDPLLQNLPFIKGKKSERYTITLEEFSQRRVSLISSILSNMREHVLSLEAFDSPDLNVSKQDYSEMLKGLMTAMRNNYQELGNGAVDSAQGAYVEFVHRILRFLQELTSDIRPVDPFFTDPAVFPLPSSDPRYIVAKLRRYEPKLSSSKELQTLTMFIQSIVERATMDGQQSHLVNQLHSAMKDGYESGLPNKPSLRAVLLQCVFPAYIELAFSNSAAWLLGLPIIKSISLVFNGLLFNLSTMDSSCVSSALGILEAVFQSTYRGLRPIPNSPARLKDPVVRIMLTALADMISSSLVVVDYIDRVTDTADRVLSYIEWFREFFLIAVTPQIESMTDAAVSVSTVSPLTPPADAPMNELSLPLTTARRLAFEDHRSCLKNWSLHDGNYYYTRPGHDSKLVILEPELAASMENWESTRLDFEDAVSDFVDRVERFNLLPE